MDYQDVIEQIASGAKKLQLCISDDELNQPFMDSNEPFVRIPISAYCLKLAHEIWRETQNIPACGSFLGPFPIPVPEEIIKETQKHKKPRNDDNV